jgi:hypothetical protein
VSHKQSIAPVPRAEKEGTGGSNPVPQDPTPPAAVYRPLQHAMNTRRAPTVSLLVAGGGGKAEQRLGESHRRYDE